MVTELLFQRLDPQKAERNYAATVFFYKAKLCVLHMQYCFTIPFLSSHTFSLFLCLSQSLCLFFFLSVSPCTLLSVMSALCVRRSGGVAEYFLIYLQAAEHIEQLSSRVCVCVCVCTFKPHLSAFYERGL